MQGRSKKLIFYLVLLVLGAVLSTIIFGVIQTQAEDPWLKDATEFAFGISILALTTGVLLSVGILGVEAILRLRSLRQCKMNHKEVESYRQRLSELTAKGSDKKTEQAIIGELQKLAREVGASTRMLWIHPNSSWPKTSEADTSELIRNIHQALQTASMINMGKTASRNFYIALIATIIALGSAIALWIAILK